MQRSGWRVRIKGRDVMLCVYDGDTLIDTFHFVCWHEVIKWGVI